MALSHGATKLGQANGTRCVEPFSSELGTIYMAYHSRYNEEVPGVRQLCGIQLVPISIQATTSPSDPDDLSSVDPVEEALVLFRANSLFRAFDVRGPGDKLLVYLILFISSCLRRTLLAGHVAPCLWEPGSTGVVVVRHTCR